MIWIYALFKESNLTKNAVVGKLYIFPALFLTEPAKPKAALQTLLCFIRLMRVIFLNANAVPKQSMVGRNNREKKTICYI